MPDSQAVASLRMLNDETLSYVLTEAEDIARRDTDKLRASVASELAEDANDVLTDRLKRRLLAEIQRDRRAAIDTVIQLAQGR